MLRLLYFTRSPGLKSHRCYADGLLHGLGSVTRSVLPLLLHRTGFFANWQDLPGKYDLAEYGNSELSELSDYSELGMSYTGSVSCIQSADILTA